MTSNIILDSDFLFGLVIQGDSNHAKSLELYRSISSSNLYISNLVKYEIATLLSRRHSQELAKTILTELENINQIFVSKDDEVAILELFYSFSKKNISVVDCSNIILAKKLNGKIASFDKFYPNELLININ